MPKRLDELTIVEARSLALAAQGFDKPRTKTKSTTADAVALIKKLGVVQIDSVGGLDAQCNSTIGTTLKR